MSCTHIPDPGVAVTSQSEGLLPLTQNALRGDAFPSLPRPMKGIALNSDERVLAGVRISGMKDPARLLRNHGTLSIGQSAAEAWLGIYFLERACRQQVMALSAASVPEVLLAPDAAPQHIYEMQAISLFPRCMRRVAGIASPA